MPGMMLFTDKEHQPSALCSDKAVLEPDFSQHHKPNHVFQSQVFLDIYQYKITQPFLFRKVWGDPFADVLWNTQLYLSRLGNAYLGCVQILLTDGLPHRERHEQILHLSNPEKVPGSSLPGQTDRDPPGTTGELEWSWLRSAMSQGKRAWGRPAFRQGDLPRDIIKKNFSSFLNCREPKWSKCWTFGTFASGSVYIWQKKARVLCILHRKQLCQLTSWDVALKNIPLILLTQTAQFPQIP